MKLFDQIDPGSLDRRMWQLWVLALTTIFILATGLALMMYTTVFAKPVGMNGHTSATLFTAYCVLMPLIIGYLLDRQLVIRSLHRTIAEGKQQISHLQHEVRANLLESLPGLAHFQDRLAMEYRRASLADQPISLIIVGVKPSPGVNNPDDLTTIYGDAAKALTSKLRGEDSIYRFEQSVFGILLPRVQRSIASHVVARVEEGLRNAARREGRFVFNTQLVNHPEQAGSAREMEQTVTAFLSARRKEGFPQIAEVQQAVMA